MAVDLSAFLLLSLGWWLLAGRPSVTLPEDLRGAVRAVAREPGARVLAAIFVLALIGVSQALYLYGASDTLALLGGESSPFDRRLCHERQAEERKRRSVFASPGCPTGGAWSYEESELQACSIHGRAP